MPAIVLADSGALFAALYTSDPWHDACNQALLALPRPLLTSEAVLTELFHFLGKIRRVQRGWDLINSGSLTLAHIGNEDLTAISTLMQRYADRPMDFADATLVHLAEREGLDTVFTVDHDDFETYRILGRRRFRILPERRPHKRRRPR